MDMGIGWTLSACFYDMFNSKLMQNIDEFIISSMITENALQDLRILDVGAGTGEFGIKLIDAGVKEILAIENNPLMLKILKSKILESQKYQSKISIIDDDMYNGTIPKLGNVNKFDAILFRRCLYGGEGKIREVLSHSFENIKQEGVIFIVHPEAEKNKYCENGVGNKSVIHMLRWHLANAGSKFAMDYTRYSGDHLENICKESCPNSSIEFYNPPRPAYNVVKISKR